MGETIPVYMSECLTPSNLFVTIIANMELLQKLEQELTQWAEDLFQKGSLCGNDVGSIALSDHINIGSNFYEI